ncbi:flagellar hook-length control protein FliK [Aquamicrobium lusatiense]|uniref:flagellar hook-length control protein FliK n=1 Tax=Aquamicrobium lusatiense TaxID=89772 RepID=UPI0024583409|nr:flagellar hook-length control protein FliK [Aquamicrobium lusatiense]MDH4990957.1 flagellar hook-length control protein FliK [Aquamicrobium lusatiense]
MEAIPPAEQRDYAAHLGATGDRLPLLISLREIERATATGEENLPASNLPADTVPEDGIGMTEAPQRDQPERGVSGIRTDTRPERAIALMDGGTTDSTPAAPGKSAPDLFASLPDQRPEETFHEKRPERVTVTSLQTFATPASVNVNPTIAALVEVLAGEEGVRQTQSLQSAASFSAPKPSGPAQSLRIELHPAELGMISARLHLSGNQLMVEIIPDTHEGWHRLSSDSETITRAMRDLGFDIGKVTILQPSATATPAGRPAEMNMPDRQASDFQSGQSGHDSSRGERHASGNNADRHEKTSTPAASSRGGTAGDLYI